MKIKIDTPSLVMVESKPCLRTIRNGRKIYPLALPYVQHWVKIQWDDPHLFLSCTPKPFKRTCKLYKLPVPQMFDSGSFCHGTYRRPPGAEKLEIVASLIHFFWNSRFHVSAKPMCICRSPKKPHPSHMLTDEWQKEYFNNTWLQNQNYFIPSNFKLCNKPLKIT